MYRNFFTLALVWLLLSSSILNAHGFAQGTLIKAGNGAGWWTIEQTVRLSIQLKKQRVASYNPDAVLWTNQRVTKGACTTTNCVCRLLFDENPDHDIICAPTQLFYRSTDHTWVPAYELSVGDCLVSDSPDEVCVLDVSLIEEPLKLYTVEVEDTHTFLVGELSIVAHNMMVPVAAVIGVSIPFGMECGGSLGAFFGPPGIIGGILIGGVIGCIVKTYNTHQVREYSLAFNPETVRTHMLDKKDGSHEAQAAGKPTETGGLENNKKNPDDKRNKKASIHTTNKQDREDAKKLGYSLDNDPPFNTHGKSAFKKSQQWISADRDRHNGGRWKMYDKTGNRIGTFDKDLNRIR